ncbi:YraN family protein [Paracoccus cavernae]|uniref:YraN family protein n=1 Tax=Paracoccus cavernae TaxID=1571207 RepID=UPI0035F21ECE
MTTADLNHHTRSIRGLVAYSGGRLAEEGVAARYVAEGYLLLETRYRSRAGEIDLILTKDGVVVFVEVKSAGSYDQAAARISRRQMDRICLAACDYVSRLPEGMLTEMRFDAALVDAQGMIGIIPNAFGEN